MVPGPGAGAEGVRLGVVVCSDPRVASETVSTALRGASRVFTKAGIAMDWLGCTHELVADVKDVQREIACHRPRHAGQVVLEILPQAAASAGLGRDAGGFARVPRTGRAAECAGVFYVRASDLARLGDASTAQVLAHLIAHEIGHVLLGAGAHAPAGIMRPAWSRRDLARAAWGQLAFEVGESEKLRAAVRLRNGR
jgi:hypothetical protein